MQGDTQTLTMEDFGWSTDDCAKADAIAKALGYGENTAYTSTSALWGLFCLPENPETAKPGQATQGGCIIKTRELGFLFVQDGEDRHLGHDWSEARPIGRYIVTHDDGREHSPAFNDYDEARTVADSLGEGWAVMEVS